MELTASNIIDFLDALGVDYEIVCSEYTFIIILKTGDGNVYGDKDAVCVFFCDKETRLFKSIGIGKW